MISIVSPQADLNLLKYLAANILTCASITLIPQTNGNARWMGIATTCQRIGLDEGRRRRVSNELGITKSPLRDSGTEDIPVISEGASGFQFLHRVSREDTHANKKWLANLCVCWSSQLGVGGHGGEVDSSGDVYADLSSLGIIKRKRHIYKYVSESMYSNGTICVFSSGYGHIVQHVYQIRCDFVKLRIIECAVATEGR